MNLLYLNNMISPAPSSTHQSAATVADSGEVGFTLLETTIALVLMMIVALGSASLFSFSVYNNTGGSDRAASLAIAQQALEALRGARFSITITDAALAGGTVVQNGIIRDGRSFNLTRVVDDNPTTAAVDVIPASTLKGITVTVTAQSTGAGWASGAGGTVTLRTIRAMTDQ